MKTKYILQIKFIFLLLLIAAQKTVNAQTIIKSDNVALYKAATASSFDTADHAALQAFDGNISTRFSSGYSDTEWISIDLGQYFLIDTLELTWATAYGKDFNILFSQTGTFTDLYNDSLQIRNNILSGTGIAGVNTIKAKANTIARYVRMQGVHRATAYGYSLFEFRIAGYSSASALLPVTLTGLTATAENNANIIKWSTTTEYNDAGFSIERSTDGTNFSPIGFVTSENGGTVTSYYSFTDNQVSNGKNYYRLEIIDLSGKTAYTNVISTNTAVINTIKTYPVPVKDHLVIEYNAATEENINVSLFTPAGQPVYNSKLTVTSGDQKITINRTANMLPGIYFVSIGSAGNKQYSEQIILQ